VRIAALIGCVLLAGGVAGAQPADVRAVLARTAEYVDRFADRFLRVVSEEQYAQQVEYPPSAASGVRTGREPSTPDGVLRKRMLRSDFLLVRTAETRGWLPFRDVFEVDGQAVRDRDARLVRLFVNADASAPEQARLITAEGARYNLGSVARTINNPLLVQSFLGREYQERFAFELRRADRAMGADVVVLEFRERTRPTIIRGPKEADIPARGRAWVEAGTGRVVRTELTVVDPFVDARVTTVFAADAVRGVHVPSAMIEEYRTRTGEVVTGRATYGGFREFTVTTEEQHRP
jgi:hypothetical protein